MLAGCGGGGGGGEEPPPPPSPLVFIGCSVVVFADANFSGASATFGAFGIVDVTNLSVVPGPCAGGTFNDCISSIRVLEGCLMQVFVDANLGGASAAFTADVADLSLIPGPCAEGTFNNCISSLRVISP